MNTELRGLRACLPIVLCFAATGCFLGACGAEDLLADDTFTMLYNSDTFQMCKGCHAPGATGVRAGVEATQDWSTRDRAFSTLQGNASGLIGNFAGCNGVPLVGNTPETSLLVAAFDEDIRLGFSLSAHPNCTPEAISDMTADVGQLSATELSLLKQFVNEEASGQ
ncbi:MAG: hypothetical protein MJE77_36410 [Proteobacteria bacterium]|nr:hypothetical protein [Pseudomonadota bacterium]